MAPIERTKRLHMLLSEVEDAMLENLADADGLSASDVVRQLVRAAYAQRFGETKPKKAKR